MDKARIISVVSKFKVFIYIFILLGLLVCGILFALGKTHSSRDNPMRGKATQIVGYTVITISGSLLIAAAYMIAKSYNVIKS